MGGRVVRPASERLGQGPIGGCCNRPPRRQGAGCLLPSPTPPLTRLHPAQLLPLQWVDVDEYTKAQPDRVVLEAPHHTLQVR